MRPFVIAHRGGAGLWPENTLAAFTRSARAKYDAAELDVQLTRDGRLVVFHDFVPNARTVRGCDDSVLSKHGPVCMWDFAALRTLDVGRPDGPAERIPLLSDVIDAVRSIHERFRLFVELKTDASGGGRSAPAEAVAEAAVTILKEKGFAENTILVGFDWAGLRHAKRLAPEIPCWFTTPYPRENRTDVNATARNDADATIRAIQSAGGDGWFAQDEDATAAAIKDARRAGLKFGVWTVNDRDRMRALAASGVDAVCTDYPDVLAAMLS